jgi:adenylate cyclase
VGGAVTLACCIISLTQPALIDNLDGRFCDTLIGFEAPPAGHLAPVVVALDDATLTRYGRWPWPRAQMALLLERIARQHPASVAVDIIFPEPESASTAAPPAAPGLSPGDLALARALASGPFVLGYNMIFQELPQRANLKTPPHPLNLVTLSGAHKDPGAGFWQARGALASRSEFNRAAGHSGFVNAALEQDGVLREMPLVIGQQGLYYPSLALAAVLRASDYPEIVLASRPSGAATLNLGTRRIALDERGRIMLRFHAWQGSREPLSAAALLEGRVEPGTLAGRVVFLGATATGMGETVTTPVDVKPLLSGVQLHAIVAESILNGDFARAAPWPAQLAAVLVMGGLATVLCAALPVLPAVLLLALGAVAAWIGASFLYQALGVLLSPVLPLVALSSCLLVALPVRLFFGERLGRLQERDLARSREFIVSSLASLTEIRDTETGAHILRTQRYLRILCEELAGYPRYRQLLDPQTIDLLAKLAPLHDIGKVGLPDHLLHKTSPFTPEEYEQVKRHTALGRDTILKAQQRAGILEDRLLDYAKDLAYAHHERWDGSGYPEGLKGEQIPWAGRVMAVADTYDALISRRIYKEPIPHRTAVRIILKGKGRLFDPDVVDAFEKVEEKWWEIACQLADDEAPKHS